MYKLLARGWREGLGSALDQEGLLAAGSVEEAAASVLINAQRNPTMVGLGHFLRRLGRNSAMFSSQSDDEETSREDGESMEEETGEDMLVQTDAAFVHEPPAHHHQRGGSTVELSSERVSTNSLDVAKAISERPQAKAVSILEAGL
jgi:hypothetical protein